ncbi:DUF724 domain-containing protein 3-like [Triticum dicoccoides]|uniref:DUF724 domain-containing protein 3-like n=1 Tax=Triticum dicoccoides TaxID=85692 RepID=UPI00188EFB09|nr:DUF724 domain-containing protein 3-like [Triticum dicoccoides]
MGRHRFRRRPPTPTSSSSSSSSSSELDDMLPVGAEVEVRNEDPGFAGSFYEATVAAHLPSSPSSSDRGGNKCYTVVYSTLEGDDGEPLQEAAAAASVRPRPPRAAPRRFAVHDMVEALHSEGWWAGVVSAVAPAPAVAGGDLRRRPRRVYQVAFPTSRETIEFQEADLRPHREFVAGRWVPAAKADNASPSFSEGDQVEVSQSGTNFGESWNPATVLKVIGATNFLVKYMHNGKDGKSATEILDSQYIRPARSITRIDSKYRFSPSSHVEILHEDSWWPGVILKVLGTGIDKKYVVMLDCHKTDLDEIDMDALRVEITQLRPLCDWDGEKWVPCLKKESAKRPISAALDNDSDKISDEPGSHRDKKKLKNADVIPEQISPLLSVGKENIEITRKQGNAVLAPRSELSPPSLPPMSSFGRLSSSSSPATSCHLAQSSSHIQASLFGAFGQSRPIPQGLPLGTRSLISSFFTGIEGSKRVLSDPDKQSTAGTGTEPFRQMEGCVSLQTAVPVGEKPETPMERIDAKAIEEGSNVVCVSEDRSQSHQGNATHDSCCPLSAEYVAVHESIMRTSGQLSESSAIQHLPIVKTSPLWAQLEALEIFRTTPQRPNLHQFQQHVPELHEGLALGLMISFADLAESINRLGVQDDNELLERKMECLAYLEASGFDVGDLRSRVEALIRMKKLEEEIAREEADDRELGTQLRALAMAVHHLELHAYLVRNVIRSTVAQRMNNAMEISRLKAEANNLSTAMPR